MVGTLRMLVASSIVAAACGGIAAPAPAKDPLAGRYTVSGGGSALEPVIALTDAFQRLHPSITWVIEDVGSDGGVFLAANGSVDLGMISRNLKESEKGAVQTLPIGVSGTGLPVAASNPVRGLTKEQVQAIYTGQLTDWSAVGGAPARMTVFLREEGSSTRGSFESYFFKAKPTYGKEVIELHETKEMLDALSSFKDAVGMVSITAATLGNAGIRFLAIDGVAATKENLVNGSYPILRALFFVYQTDPAKLSPAIREFLDFVRGPEGQKIVAGL